MEYLGATDLELGRLASFIYYLTEKGKRGQTLFCVPRNYQQEVRRWRISKERSLSDHRSLDL
jgi:hypothetical protein